MSASTGLSATCPPAPPRPPAPPLPPPPAPDERPRPPRRRRRRLPASPAASAAGLEGSAWRSASAGMVSPILGLGGAPGGDALGTRALAAASTEAGRPSRWRSGSSGVRSSGPAAAGAPDSVARDSPADGSTDRAEPVAGAAAAWVLPSVRGLLRLRPPREPRRRRLRPVLLSAEPAPLPSGPVADRLDAAAAVGF